MNNYLIGGIATLAFAGIAAFAFTSNSSSSDSGNPEPTQSSNLVASTVSNEAGNGSDDTGTVALADASANTTFNDSSSSEQVVNAKPRLHPVEAVCIDYVMSGQMMNGTTTRCHRNYAYEQYEISNTEIGFGGMTQSQNQHTITIGDTIYAIDLQTNRGTKTTNPMYAGLASAMENATPEEMATVFISSMGFSPTGVVKTIANTQCNVYSAPQLGNACLTDNGLMLEQEFMGNTQTAESVSFNGGDDANYTLYQNVPITQGPDLSNGIGGLIDQIGQQQ